MLLKGSVEVQNLHLVGLKLGVPKAMELCAFLPKGGGLLASGASRALSLMPLRLKRLSLIAFVFKWEMLHTFLHKVLQMSAYTPRAQKGRVYKGI